MSRCTFLSQKEHKTSRSQFAFARPVITIQREPVSAVSSDINFPMKGRRGMKDWARTAEDKLYIPKEVFTNPTDGTKARDTLKNRCQWPNKVGCYTPWMHGKGMGPWWFCGYIMVCLMQVHHKDESEMRSQERSRQQSTRQGLVKLNDHSAPLDGVSLFQPLYKWITTL